MLFQVNMCVLSPGQLQSWKVHPEKELLPGKRLAAQALLGLPTTSGKAKGLRARGNVGKQVLSKGSHLFSAALLLEGTYLTMRKQDLSYISDKEQSDINIIFPRCLFDLRG